MADRRTSVKSLAGYTEKTKQKREDTQSKLRKARRDGVVGNKRRNVSSTPLEDASSMMQMASGPTANGGPTANAIDAAVLASALPQFIANLTNPDPNIHLAAATYLRKILSIQENPPLDIVIQMGGVQPLVGLLSSPNQVVQFEAAWSLTNIASGTSEHTRAIVNAGGVPPFVALLSSPNPDVSEQALWALGNIAGESPEFRDFVISCQALKPLLQLVSDPRTSQGLLRNACWALSNLCRGKPEPIFSEVKEAIPVLAQLVYHTDEEVVIDSLWSLSYLSDGGEEKVSAVVESGVCRRLSELLLHPSIPVATAALRTVGNIVTGNDTHTQVVINCNALTALGVILRGTKKGLLKEACWAVSNILAGTRRQVGAVIEAELIPPLIDLMKCSEFEIRKEAAWGISNACSGGAPEHLRYMVKQGCIPPLCGLLRLQDSHMVMVALDGIENILKVGLKDAEMRDGNNAYAILIEECDGLENIEDLQNHHNPKIFEKAAHILEVYFDAVDEQGIEEDEAEQEAMANAAASQQPYSFQVSAPAEGFHFL